MLMISLLMENLWEEQLSMIINYISDSYLQAVIQAEVRASVIRQFWIISSLSPLKHLQSRMMKFGLHTELKT